MAPLISNGLEVHHYHFLYIRFLGREIVNGARGEGHSLRVMAAGRSNPVHNHLSFPLLATTFWTFNLPFRQSCTAKRRKKTRLYHTFKKEARRYMTK